MVYLAARYEQNGNIFFVKAKLYLDQKDVLFCSCGGNEGMPESNIFVCNHIKLTREHQRKEGKLILLSRIVPELDSATDDRRSQWLIERNVKQFIM